MSFPVTPRQVKPIPFKPPRLVELGEELITRHYEQVYGGLIQQINQEPAINPLTASSRVARSNAAVLHEIFFDSLGGADGLGGPAALPFGPLAAQLTRVNGSVDAWQDNWRGMAATNGAGQWLVLAWNLPTGELVDVVTTPKHSLPVSCVPLLAICLEPAVINPDFAGRLESYVAAVFNNLNWQRLNERFERLLPLPGAEQALVEVDEVSATDLLAELAAASPPVVLDVCLPEDRIRRHDRVLGAVMLTPDDVSAWAASHYPCHPVVVYCLYGYQVSGNAVAQLSRAGISARRLAGGIAAWHATGGPTEAFK